MTASTNPLGIWRVRAVPRDGGPPLFSWHRDRLQAERNAKVCRGYRNRYRSVTVERDDDLVCKDGKGVG